MTVFHHKIATKWLEKQPQVRVASLWLSGVCLKVANRKKDFLNRARQMAGHYHNPKLYERAQAIVDSSGYRFEGMEEDDRYHYPNDQRAYDFALRHLDHGNPSEVVGLYRDADAFFNSRSGDVKKQYEKDLRELDFKELKERTPSLSNAKDWKSDKEVLHEDDRWRVVVPLSHRSMRGEGTDTGWCIATENTGHACTYRKDDNLHIFVIDKPKARGGKNAYGKYALTSNGLEGTADVRDTYDEEGPGHGRSLKEAFPAVATKMGLPDDIRDQVLKTYEEKYPELDARMKEYPRNIKSQNIYRGLSADILYGNLLDTASPEEIQELSRSEISPDAKTLIRLKQFNTPLRAEIDPQSVSKQLLKVLYPLEAPSHLNATQIAKAFEISPKQAKEALGVVQKALGKPSSDNRSHSSEKKQRAQEQKQKQQETSFKQWLDKRYKGTGIQNPNPGLKDPIDPDTLLTYAGNSDYEFQSNAIRIKKQLWDQWWKESEEKRETDASKLRDQIWAYEPRNIHPNAKVENPENIEPGVLVDKDAVISGDANVSDYVQVTGGEISGNAWVVGNAQVSGGKISGGSVSGNAQVSGGKISGGRVSGDAQVSGDAKISGGYVFENAEVSGGEISGDGSVYGNAQVSGGKISGGKVTGGKISGDAKISGNALVVGNAQVTGGEISGGVVEGDAQVTGGEISGGTVSSNAQMSGGTISSGFFSGKCKIHGGNWDEKILKFMRSMPEYGKHFSYYLDPPILISGEWDDVPEDVKKNLEDFGPTGQHPDAKIENPENIGPYVLVGKDAVISGKAEVRGNVKVTGGEISGGSVTDDAEVSGGKISGGEVYENAKVSGGKISGGRVSGDAQVTGGEISGGWVFGNAKVSGGEISGGGYVLGNAQISGGEISGVVVENAKVSGDAKISGGLVAGNAQVSGGTISGGQFGGDCKIHGGNWDEKTLSVMSKMPKYEKHFSDDAKLMLISGEWDDVPNDVKKKLEEQTAR